MFRRIYNKLQRIKTTLCHKYEDYLFHKYKENAVSPFAPSIFTGKRVVVIGGADSAFKEKVGTFIDGFDVVVRVNKGVEVVDQFSEFIGKRTDVLFHCFFEDEAEGGSPITPALWEKHNVKQLLMSHNSVCSNYAYRNFYNFLFKTKGKVGFSQISGQQHQANFEALHGAAPTTGFIAIKTILDSLPKELYITGITFFKTAHQQEYRKGTVEDYKTMFNKSSSHNPEFEYQYVKEQYLKFPNCVKPDPILSDIFNNN